MSKPRARINRLSAGWLVSIRFEGKPMPLSASALSSPEAMQAAQLLLREADRMLMDEIHESRAARRCRCKKETTT